MGTLDRATEAPVDLGLAPAKYDVFGVQVSATSYAEVVDFVVRAGRNGTPAILSFHSVHALISSADDEELLRRVNTFDVVAPDGQPVRWALNWLHGTGLTERVYGPEAMLRVCERAAREGLPIYLYGGSADTVGALTSNLQGRFPGLVIAGAEAPPFRPLTPEEDRAVCERIAQSGARILFIGLGCPKQDHFAFEHKSRIRAVQLCVGAAFDFHAGAKPMAPAWMQRRGLEWLFRLSSEPGRLWRRYLATNSRFIYKLVGALLSRKQRIPAM